MKFVSKLAYGVCYCFFFVAGTHKLQLYFGRIRMARTAFQTHSIYVSFSAEINNWIISKIEWLYTLCLTRCSHFATFFFSLDYVWKELHLCLNCARVLRRSDRVWNTWKNLPHEMKTVFFPFHSFFINSLNGTLYLHFLKRKMVILQWMKEKSKTTHSPKHIKMYDIAPLPVCSVPIIVCGMYGCILTRARASKRKKYFCFELKTKNDVFPRTQMIIRAKIRTRECVLCSIFFPLRAVCHFCKLKTEWKAARQNLKTKLCVHQSTEGFCMQIKIMMKLLCFSWCDQTTAQCIGTNKNSVEYLTFNGLWKICGQSVFILFLNFLWSVQ